MILENAPMHMCDESIEALRDILYTYGDSSLTDVHYFLGITNDLLGQMKFERILLHQTINKQTLRIVASLITDDADTKARSMRKLMHMLLTDYGISASWVQSLLEGLSIVTGAPTPDLPERYIGGYMERGWDSEGLPIPAYEELDVIELASEYKLFVDASFLMADGALDFFENLQPILQQKKSRIIIPIVTVDKVRKAAWEEETAVAGNRAAWIIRLLQAERLADFRSGPDDDNESDVFERVFDEFYLRYNLCLFTNDGDLADRIKKIQKKQTDQSTKSILIASLVSKGGRYKLRPFACT